MCGLTVLVVAQKAYALCFTRRLLSLFQVAPELSYLHRVKNMTVEFVSSVCLHVLHVVLAYYILIQNLGEFLMLYPKAVSIEIQSVFNAK